ncbi:MAG: NADP-dependent phosphogluconate dehydrogenase [Vicinamibacterales bacterium]
MQYQVGMIGLGVMGANLALNIEEHGFPVACLDVDRDKAAAVVSRAGPGRKLEAASSAAGLAEMLERPRRVVIMVPAGAAVDEAIARISSHLQPGDVLVDGGNSHFADTERRCRELQERGFLYLGTGISGGELGARRGPSIMPGGCAEAWDAMRPVFTAIAARAGDGQPCAEYMGPRGAGHFVKMVHNAIEYANMQLIAEIYDLLHRGCGLPAAAIAEVFREWNEGELRSYLVEITADILSRVDVESGRPLVDVILDEAAQKGTGKWASQSALDLGAPVPTIDAAVEARILSSFKSERVAASAVLAGPSGKWVGSRQAIVSSARDALYAAKIVSYAQGFSLMRHASLEYGYELRPARIAKVWRAGCIIRAGLLEAIMAAYEREPSLANLLLDDAFREALGSRQGPWRRIVGTAVELGIPMLALCSSLAYYDAYRSERLPANLLQAQRDYFGAHTYRRVDRPGVFHTVWTGDMTE